MIDLESRVLCETIILLSAEVEGPCTGVGAVGDCCREREGLTLGLPLYLAPIDIMYDMYTP